MQNAIEAKNTIEADRQILNDTQAKINTVQVELDSLIEYVTKQTEYEALQRKIDAQKTY